MFSNQNKYQDLKESWLLLLPPLYPALHHPIHLASQRDIFSILDLPPLSGPYLVLYPAVHHPIHLASKKIHFAT